MTARRRLVRVPASSANLGPGYDVLAAALTLSLEVEVEETGEFSVEAAGLIGDKTRAAIRQEQQRLGLKTDGRAGQKLLDALRRP